MHHSCLWQQHSPYEACSASNMALAPSGHIATHFGQGISCSRFYLQASAYRIDIPPASHLRFFSRLRFSLFMEGVLVSSEGRSSEPPSVVSDEELLFREITKRSIISNCMVMAGNVFWHQIAKSAYVAIMIK